MTEFNFKEGEKKQVWVPSEYAPIIKLLEEILAELKLSNNR